MLINNENTDVSEPIDEELSSVQKEIIREIRKTQTIMIFQMVSLLLFALANGGFFVPYIIYEVTGNVLIPRIIIAFFFFISVLRSAIKFSPFLRKGYKILHETEYSNGKHGFQTGIVHYVAEFYQLYKHGKNKYVNETKSNPTKKVPKVFIWELIAFLIIGVLLIGYDTILLVWYPTFTSQELNIILFSITITFYCTLLILTMIIKKRTDNWVNGYLQIENWGKNLELKSSKKEKME